LTSWNCTAEPTCHIIIIIFVAARFN
jgi:hypothetical protein